MAPFAPYTGTPNAPNYLNLSKEPDRIRPDTSLGTLFSGIGDLAGNLIEGADKIVADRAEKYTEDQIRPEIVSDITRLKNTLGITDPAQTPKPAESQSGRYDELTTSPGGQPLNIVPQGEGIPPDLQASFKKMDTLAQAKNINKIENADFQGRLHEIVANARSRYPGYTKQIEAARDRAVGSAAGTYRSSLEALYQSLQTKTNDGKSKWETEMHSDRELLGTDYPRAIAAWGNPDQMAYWRSRNADMRAAKYVRDRNTEKMQDAKLAGELNEDGVIRGSSTIYANIYSELSKATQYKLADGSSGKFEMTMNDIEKRIAQIQTSGGGQAEQTELVYLGGLLSHFKSVLVQAMDAQDNKKLFDPYVDEKGVQRYRNSSNDLVKDKNKLKEARKEVLDHWDAVARQVGEKNLTLATNMLNTVAGMNELGGLQLTRQNPAIQALGALSSAVPGQSAAIAVNTVLENTKGTKDNPGPYGPGGLLGGATQGMKDFRPIKGITTTRALEIAGLGKGSLNTNLEDYKAAAEKNVNLPPKPDSRFMQLQIDVVRNLLTDKLQGPEAKANVARVITHPGTIDFLESFTPTQQFNAWSRLSTREVADEMHKLGPQAMQDYRQWSELTFKRLFGNWIREANTALTNPEGRDYQIGWDEKNTAITYTRPGVYGRISGRGIVPADATTIAIDRLNTGLQVLKNVLAADGIELNKEYLNRMGIKTDKVENPTTGQIINSLLQKLPSPETVTKTLYGGEVKDNTPEIFQKKSNFNAEENQQTIAQWMENPTGQLSQATNDIGLSKQEQNLYNVHLYNLKGSGGIDNPDGTRSTLKATTVDVDGKTYLLPTVWKGKEITDPQELIKQAEKVGLDTFPSYKTEEEAQKRYELMHQFMEQDTQSFQKLRGKKQSFQSRRATR